MNKMAESAHRENLLSAVSASKETDDPSMRAVITLAKSLEKIKRGLEKIGLRATVETEKRG